MNFPELPDDWNKFLKSETEQVYFQNLKTQVLNAYQSQMCYPAISDLFHAFETCTLSNTKVVLLGQDPYHGPKQANGLSFSVSDGQKIPPSLKNIFRELISDIHSFEIPSSGNLELWAKEGVLLLNAILSVEAGKPGSHKLMGWEQFTDAVIKHLSDSKPHLVFLLWGNFARSKKHFIDETKHLVLCAAHPSPLARGAFFGSRHFSQTNNFLKSKGLNEINWNLSSGLTLNFD